MKYSIIVSLGFVLCLINYPLLGEENIEKASIASLVDSMLNSPNQDPQTGKEVAEINRRLRLSDEAQRQRLAAELFDRLASDNSERTGLLSAFIFHWFGLRDRELIVMCSQFLFHENERHRNFAGRMLEVDFLHSNYPRRQNDFAPIGMVLSRSDDKSVHRNLIKYMFQSDPSSAFDTMSVLHPLGVETTKPLQFKKDQTQLLVNELRFRGKKFQQPSADERATLSRLLKELLETEEIWVKLYVAETLRRNRPIFQGKPDYLGLESDSSELVRDAVSNENDRFHCLGSDQ